MTDHDSIADHQQPLIEQAFDPEAFRATGHRWIESLTGYLTAAQRGELPVMPWRDPVAATRAWPSEFPAPREHRDALLSQVLASSTHLHHPGYVAHQVATTLPLAALCDLVSALLNNGSIYEMGPTAMAMERALGEWFLGQLGLPTTGEVIFTSGGSLGNLTAMLAARARHGGYDPAVGATSGPPLAVLASEQAHYSIQRAADILGWGADGVIPVPVDDAYRMRPDQLGPALDRAQRAGRRVIAVVALAGGVPSAAFDPLPAIADFCAQHSLWFHVDGAHGASAVLSSQHRHLVAGIERADSVVWDAHKMMMMPSLITAVAFRDATSSYATFEQDASYLLNEPTPWADTCNRTFECTKNTMAFKLYATLAHFGPELWTAFVDRMFALGAAFGRLIAEADDFELGAPVTCNIVVFRHLIPGSPHDLDAHQTELRRAVRARGHFHVVQAELRSRVYLRTSLMNPKTTLGDLRALLDEIRAAAAAA